MIMDEFAAVVDKCQVTLVTDPVVCTPPPVMEASSPKVMPVGVMPLNSRLQITRPLEMGSMPRPGGAAQLPDREGPPRHEPGAADVKTAAPGRAPMARGRGSTSSAWGGSPAAQCAFIWT